MRVVMVGLFALTGLMACADPKDTLAAVIDDAAACAEGDTCVVAGATDCSCGGPVNSARVDEVEAAAARVSCCDLLGRCIAVECAAFENVRCEAGRCVAD